MRKLTIKSIENLPQITVNYEGYGCLYDAPIACALGGNEQIGFFKGVFKVDRRLNDFIAKKLVLDGICEVENLSAIDYSTIMFKANDSDNFISVECYPEKSLVNYGLNDTKIRKKLWIQDSEGNNLKMTIQANGSETTLGENTITLLKNVKTQHEYISTELKMLNEAAKFWANADPDDKDTHPTNKQVADWLKARGFSAISAEQGAVIIRPDWATKGRRK